MLNKILFALQIFLTLTGLITIIYFSVMKLLTPKRKPLYLLILPLSEEKNPSALIGSSIEKRNLCFESPYCEIIAVDMGLDADTRNFLEYMYNNTDKFLFCDYEQLNAEIEKRLSPDCSLPAPHP